MLFKLSNLNSNLALTLGYLNPALNNSAQFSGKMQISRALGRMNLMPIFQEEFRVVERLPISVGYVWTWNLNVNLNLE